MHASRRTHRVVLVDGCCCQSTRCCRGARPTLSDEDPSLRCLPVHVIASRHGSRSNCAVTSPREALCSKRPPDVNTCRRCSCSSLGVHGIFCTIATASSTRLAAPSDVNGSMRYVACKSLAVPDHGAHCCRSSRAPRPPERCRGDGFVAISSLTHRMSPRSSKSAHMRAHTPSRCARCPTGSVASALRRSQPRPTAPLLELADALEGTSATGTPAVHRRSARPAANHLAPRTGIHPCRCQERAPP